MTEKSSLNESHKAKEEEEEEEGRIKRRQLIRGVAITGGGAVFGANLSGTAGASSTTQHVDKLSSREEQLVINKIKNDPEVATLSAQLKEKELQYREGKYGAKTTKNGQRSYFGVVPINLSNTDDSIQSILQWSEENDRKPQIVTLEQKESTGNNLADFREETQWVEGTTVRSNSILHSPKTEDSGNNMKVGIDGSSIGLSSREVKEYDDCKTLVQERCTNFNLSCISFIVGAVGLSCNPFTGLVTCVLGSGIAFGPYTTGDGCDICDEYSVRESVIEGTC
ncbi:hypothetical protein JMJ58_20945 (plasmid) [Haloterrigena salifodinae]|uniref:Halocin C8 n=1 Tax=Haloterrigena salifodinae TaxID=2675099 RepID=A0A8T8E7J2_9EURY|nr:hypothetical protein [Haloterrigena salifodinae]QRV17426.1 hypothetical protein JMJ58_20945 [Haloterrigena salifodinae]